MSGSPRCAICKEPASGQPSSTLTKKGSDSINEAGKSRNDDIDTSPGELVHQYCRKKYTSEQQIAKATKKIELEDQVDKNVGLRSYEMNQFHYDTDCLFCGKSAHFGNRKKSSKWDVFQVRTLEFKENISINSL
jgi:hypothetical protein